MATMRFIPGPDECENVDGYEEGGFHPVLVGDKFCERYTVVHKLGSGGYATVWLVRDAQENRYAALKILTADSSSYSEELAMYEHLQKNGPEEYEKCRVVPLFDTFWSESINGRHLCLVFEVMGPSVASFQRGKMRKVRPDIVRKVALETARGLTELHERGVVYGDLSAANLLFRLANIDEWTTEELYDKLGRPEAIEMEEAVLREAESSGQAWYCGKPCEDPHAPKSLYMPINLSALSPELLRPEVRFIDLGEAYLTDSPPEGFGINFNYADPETLWWSEKPEQASDIWALACVWYELRAADQLFGDGGFAGSSGIKNDIIDTVGALPAPWLEQVLADWAAEQAVRAGNKSEVEAESDNVAAGATPLKQRFRSFWSWLKTRFSKKSAPGSAQEPQTVEEDEHGRSLSQKIKNIGKWKPWCYLSIEEREKIVREFDDYVGADEDTRTPVDTGNPPPGPLAEDEAADFEDILRSMLTYERADRIAIAKVMDHPWLRKEYEQATSEPWLQQFHPGLTLGRYDYATKKQITVI